MQRGFELPEPTAAAKAHSDLLRQLLSERIAAAGGAISFAEYMELALYAPGLGYYSAGSTKFGPGGDFITAPELSPLFGATLADFSAGVLQRLGGGTILELGAGSGALAASLLAAWPRHTALPERYLILEPSADLRERQQQLLAARVPALLQRVHWLSAWPDPPLRGLVLANEVLDALPVLRFRWQATGAVELAVGLTDAGGFGWAERPADLALARALDTLTGSLGQSLPAGYVGELCPLLPGWMAGLANSLESGVALLIDYGSGRREHYHPERNSGSLRCFYRHRVHDDPFRWPGLQDITASVDFTAVAEAASASGLELAAYCTQAAFLLAAGFEQRFAAAIASGEDKGLAAASAARTLLLPGEMGEYIKAIILQRGQGGLPDGFHPQDLRHTL